MLTNHCVNLSGGCSRLVLVHVYLRRQVTLGVMWLIPIAHEYGFALWQLQAFLFRHTSNQFPRVAYSSRNPDPCFPNIRPPFAMRQRNRRSRLNVRQAFRKRR